MSDTTFIPRKTSIVSTWLNDVNGLTYHGVRTGDSVLAAAIMQYSEGGAGAVQRSIASKLQEQVSVLDFGADSTGAVDSSAAFQAAAAAARTVFVPAGVYKLTSSVNVPAGTIILGAGVLSTAINGYGVDPFHVAAGVSFVLFKDFRSESFTSGGGADPRTFTCVRTLGVSGNTNQYINYENLYLQGWNKAIENDYVFNSNLDNVTTVNVNIPLDLFGQCVGTVINSSHLVANSGLYSIQTRKDSGIQGEGLQVSSTLLSSGVSAVKSDGFLSMGFDASCVIDLCSGKAFDLSGVSGFKCDAQWVYSTDSCFNFADQGAPVETNAVINVGLATCAGSATAVYWGANNSGLTLLGNIYLPSGAGYPVSVNGTNATIRPYIKNGTAQAAVRVNTAGNTIAQSGDRSVEWAVSPIATLPSNNALVLPRNGCSTILISGTTNITSISATSWAGQEVTLIFQGALTVTDGSNLHIAGNFVTTADDTLRLVCDGTNWYETSRSVN